MLLNKKQKTYLGEEGYFSIEVSDFKLQTLCSNIYKL